MYGLDTREGIRSATAALQQFLQELSIYVVSLQDLHYGTHNEISKSASNNFYFILKAE